jgi:hypothetical protein
MRLSTLISTSAAAIVIMASPVNAYAGPHAQPTPPIEVKCSVTTDLGCTAPSADNDATVRFTPVKTKSVAALKVTTTFGARDTFDPNEEIAIAAPDGTYIGVANMGSTSRTSATFTIDASHPALLAAALSSRTVEVFAVQGSMYVSGATVTVLS